MSATSADNRAWWLRFTATWPGVLFVFIVAAFIAYAPALNGPPIWDDSYLVGTNPFFRSPIFAGEAFRHWLFLDSTSHYYRPVQNLSYQFDYWLWAGAAFGYHFTNIMLHGLCGAALFSLLKRRLPDLEATLTNTPSVALGVALLWTVHPAHNAAIAYIAGRADSLAMLGAIIAWLLADRARDSQGFASIALGLLAALCGLTALCAKELAIFWFVLFGVHLALLAAGSRKTRFLAALAALLVVGAYLVLRSLPETHAGTENPTLAASERGLLILRALGDYTGLLLWPARLMMDRSISGPVMYDSYALWLDNLQFEYLSLVGLAALLFVLWKCRSLAAGRRWRIAGAVWFTLGFLPISNLFPLNAQVAEHWIYHASIGAFIFAAGCLAPWTARQPRFIALAVTAAALALTVRTAVRAGDWADPERFYVKNIKSGGGTPRIHSQLAQVYFQRGDYVRQEKILRELLARFPEHSVARINLANCLAKQGRKAEAEPLLQRETTNSQTRFPRTWTAALQLIDVRTSSGDLAGALQVSADALQRFPGTWQLVAADTQLRLKNDDAAAARAQVEAFAAAHWWHLDAWLTLADLRARTGDLDAAAQALRQVARLDIYDARPFDSLAALEAGRGHLEAAAAAQRQAIRRGPAKPTRHLFLAELLEKLGRQDEAAKARAEADALRASIR